MANSNDETTELASGLSRIPKDIRDYLKQFNTQVECYHEKRENKGKTKYVLVVKLTDMLFPEKSMEVNLHIGCLETDGKARNRETIAEYKEIANTPSTTSSREELAAKFNVYLTWFIGNYGLLYYSILDNYFYAKKFEVIVKLPVIANDKIIEILEQWSAPDFCVCSDPDTRKRHTSA